MNILTITSVILIIVSILLTIRGYRSLKNIHHINLKIDEQNKKLLDQKQTLISNIKTYQQDINFLEDKLKYIQNNISQTLDNQKELSQKAFENYCDILEKKYQEKEEEYDLYEKALDTAYSHHQLELLEQINQYQADLDKIKATRDAALQAKIKEKEIKEKLSFYCLSINEADIDDIKVLNKIKPQLHNPRILNMLIWKTYFQKPMADLCNNVIGTETKSGIYKITNQLDDMCYIGQSVDLATRWKDHAKCGLGIDTPQGNKLYQAMIQYGLWNFSFEILEECPKQYLDEKEKYYIQLYQSYDYGFNSNKGIGK